MNRKTSSIAAIFINIALLASLISPYIMLVSAADPTDWYMTVNGVLKTDKYTLYPFKSELLKVGLSKFGELIDDSKNVGLEYAGDRDPFAPIAGLSVPPELQKNVWINGWYIDIRYKHSTWGDRCVWAGALFADITDYGGPWLRVDNDYGSCTYEWQEAFNLPGKEIDVSDPVNVIGPLRAGGRKTNGTVLTDPMQILYNGPRLFVAKITNHIYDWNQAAMKNRHLVDLVLTVIFNKVKKEVIVIKDVKLVPPAKFEVSPLEVEVGSTPFSIPCGYLVQLSNREEWDLGTVYAGTTSYSSYVHFYVDYEDEEKSTAYNYDWTMLPTVPEGTKYKDVQICKWGDEPDREGEGEYDVAQIISNDLKYVGWHAFWPSLSDWSVTAGDDGTWFRALEANDPHNIDGYNEPWRSPLVVGEWDFILSDSERKWADTTLEADVQFRAVSVYGVTDLNDGDDEDIGDGHSNNIDREVMYQLEEIFEPWDLYKAVEKETWRFVIFVKEPKDAGDTVVLIEPLPASEWDEYCGFAERVILLPDGKLWVRGTDYELVDTDANGYLDSIKLITALPSGKQLKILFSGDASIAPAPGPGRYEWVIVGRDAKTVDSAGAALVTAAFKDKVIESLISGGDTVPKSGALIGLAGADMFDPVIANQMPWVMAKFGTGNTMSDYYYSATDKRTALKDDWCCTWPIASSNMIGVGGPLANLLAYYGNDFAQAIFGLDAYTDYSVWENAIIPLTCWDMTKTRAYKSSNDVGYAVISTYKDINGTVIFLVWGHWGRDTYYVSKWFHEKGIYQLQDAPEGLTSIIVEIKYKSTAEGYKPTSFSIVECLGTISETLWVHEGGVTEYKGGIHDP